MENWLSNRSVRFFGRVSLRLQLRSPKMVVFTTADFFATPARHCLSRVHLPPRETNRSEILKLVGTDKPAPSSSEISEDGKNSKVRIRVCPSAVFEGLDVGQVGIQLVGTGIFSNYLKSGDGVLIYQPNADHSECQVLAVCEVVSTYPDVGRTSLDVRRGSGTLHPDSHARWRWAKNPYLCLDVSKVKKYGMIRFFTEAFGEREWNEDSLEDSVREVFRPDLSLPTLMPKEGVIYLIRGSSLHKIGKTTDLESRKRQIERDVQESLEVVHTITSNDITRAELSLHERYKSVRRWGEWFDLTPTHVTEICSIERLEM